MVRIGGFRFGAAAAGVKKAGSDRLDVGLIAADAPCPAAAVFTQNRVAAAPVLVSREAVRAGRLAGVVVNAGNANACTGKQGLADARAMARLAGEAVGVPRRGGGFAVCSTGVIGLPLPMDRMCPGIAAAAAALSADGFDAFSRAILTTDKGPKVHVARAGAATVAGCAKGAGMIAPNMATTLAFVVTDAAVPAPWLRRTLRAEADATFNAVTVDGDTSTNDSLFLLASGAAGRVRENALRAAIHEVLDALATAIVRDGEGATRVVRVVVRGAATTRAARAVARSIAQSPLVKTAIAGSDPNWGRVLAAAGNAGIPLDPGRLDLDVGDVPLVRRGAGVHATDTESAAHAVMQRPEYTFTLDLHAGKAQAAITTCDLTHEYISINADYRS